MFKHGSWIKVVAIFFVFVFATMGVIAFTDVGKRQNTVGETPNGVSIEYINNPFWNFSWIEDPKLYSFTAADPFFKLVIKTENRFLADSLEIEYVIDENFQRLHRVALLNEFLPTNNRLDCLDSVLLPDGFKMIRHLSGTNF